MGTTAIIAGSVIGAAGIGASVAGASAQSSATKEASKTQAEATSEATALQREMYEKSLAMGRPFYDVGISALPDLEAAIRGGYDFKSSPVAKYAVQTGGRALMRGLAARGLAGSGLAPFKLGELESQIYATDYDRQIARLSGLVDIGRGTSSELSRLGQQYGATAGEIGMRSGESQAAAQLALGRGQASLYQGMGQLPMSLASLYIMGGGKF